MTIKEEVLKEEYWKIEDTLRLIKIAKEDKRKGVVEKTTITKDYINHLSTNINLMREAGNFYAERTLAEVGKENEVFIKKLKEEIMEWKDKERIKLDGEFTPEDACFKIDKLAKELKQKLGI